MLINKKNVTYRRHSADGPLTITVQWIYGFSSLKYSTDKYSINVLYLVENKNGEKKIQFANYLHFIFYDNRFYTILLNIFILKSMIVNFHL